MNVGQQQKKLVHTERLMFNHYGKSNVKCELHEKSLQFPPKTSITLHEYRKTVHNVTTVSENSPNLVTSSAINYLLRGSGSIG